MLPLSNVQAAQVNPDFASQVGTQNIVVPTVAQQAEVISKGLGKYSVTVKTPTMQIRYDLVGRNIGMYPLHTYKFIIKNFINGVQMSISRASKKPSTMSQQDMLNIINFIKRLKK